MRGQLEKERTERKNKLIFYITGGLIAVYGEVYALHFMTLKSIYKRATTTDLLDKVNDHILKHPFELKVTAGDVSTSLLIMLMALFAVMHFISNKNLRKSDDPESVNEARLMGLKDVKEFNKKRNAPYGEESNDGFDNMILSKDIRLGMDGYKTRRNQNILIIGASGAGKSRFFAAPNILQYNSNFVITDPSGELLRAYGKALEDNGYRVKIINITNPYKSNHYNPFHYIKEEKDVFIVVNSIIKNTTPQEKTGGDPFFDDAANLLLSAIMLYMWHKYDKSKQTMSEMVSLLNLGQIDENSGTGASPLDTKFEELRLEDPGNLAVRQYDSFKVGGAKTLKSVLITASTRLRIFSLAEIDYLMSSDDVEFETFNDSKQALFVIIPTADTTFNAIISLMYSQLFTTLYRYGEQRVQYSWNLEAGHEKFKTFQAVDAKTSKIAQKKAVDLCYEIQGGTRIVPNKKKKVYEVRTLKTNTLLGWRGNKKAAEMLQELYKKTKVVKGDPDGRAPNHTRFILDEFANISQMPDFEKLVATMRKYNISVDIIIQALSQLKAIYKDHWNDIIGNCDTKLVLGCEDTETLKWIIEVQGKRHIKTENISIGDGNKFSSSFQNSASEVMTIDQLANMKEDECYIKVRGERPFFGKKYELTLHPNYAHAMKTKGKYESGINISNKILPFSERERANRKKTDALYKSEIEDDEALTPKKKSAEEVRAENRARETLSKEAKGHKESIKEPPINQEELAKTVMGSLGLTETSSDEDIKKAVDHAIEIQFLDSSEILQFTAV